MASLSSSVNISSWGIIHVFWAFTLQGRSAMLADTDGGYRLGTSNSSLWSTCSISAFNWLRVPSTERSVVVSQ